MQNTTDSRENIRRRDSPPIRAQSIAQVSPRVLARTSNNLPVPLSSFIGREREIAEVKRLLATSRLVTLTGPGGCGKTRLAIQVAGALVESVDDGVWFIDLAPLADPALVAQQVAAVLGVREQPDEPILDTLVDALRAKDLVLVLDNCEHVIDACARLADALLRACPNLSILSTSREALGMTGERAWTVPSLSLPDARKELPLFAELMRCEAVQLFVARAAAIEPSFQLNELNAAVVATICQQLDGIPLAIELAAARVKLLQPAEIAARLNDRFRLLTLGSRPATPRHQTLRAAIDWSYDVLSEPERMLLRRLAVFSGGCTLEAAESVCSRQFVSPSAKRAESSNQEALSFARFGSGETTVLRHEEILDLLSHLVDKSLVIVDKQGVETRYHMLETIRQYAREKLLETGEWERVQDRHLDFFLHLAEAIEWQLYNGDQFAALDRFHAEYDNLRGAMDWWVAREDARGEDGLWLTGALRWFWFIRNLWSEGRVWYDRVLAKSCSGPTIAKAARAKSLNGAAMLAMMQYDFLRANELAQESLALSEEIGDVRRIGIAFWNLAACANKAGDYDAAVTLSKRAISHLRQVEDHFHLAWALGAQGIALLNLRDFAGAIAIQEERVEVSRKTGNAVGLAITLRDLGRIREHLGDYAQALPLFEEALMLFQKLDNQWGRAEMLAFLAEVALHNRDYGSATELCEQSREIARALTYKGCLSWALDLLGIALAWQSEFVRAAGCFGASLELYQESNNRQGIAEVLMGLSGVAIGEGNIIRGVKLLGAGESLLREVGIGLGPVKQEDYDRHLARARADLDQLTFEAAWTEGRAMTLEQSIKYALAEIDETVAAPARTQKKKERLGGLTAREREIATCIAHGMSNREIAQDLVVSDRTVETHVTNILNKLGFTRRAQIRKWAIEIGLVKRAK